MCIRACTYDVQCTLYMQYGATLCMCVVYAHIVKLHIHIVTNHTISTKQKRKQCRQTTRQHKIWCRRRMPHYCCKRQHKHIMYCAFFFCSLFRCSNMCLNIYILFPHTIFIITIFTIITIIITIVLFKSKVSPVFNIIFRTLLLHAEYTLYTIQKCTFQTYLYI